VRAALVLILLAGVARAADVDVTAAGRVGVYQDTDETQVIRLLAAAEAAIARWHLSVRESIDVVSSASVDVRSSPFIDAVSGASPGSTEKRAEMKDRRFETSVGAAYDDDRGHTGALSLVYAFERDYTSVGAGATGTLDLSGARTTTLLGAINGTYNTITSVVDPLLHRNLGEIGYTLGLARVVGPNDAARLRYDGSFLGGYQSSPYRRVRFGMWRAAPRTDSNTLVFLGTIGSPDGIAETVPDWRLRHAAVLEWVHGLGDGIAVQGSARGSIDSWSLASLTLGVELRVMQPRWQLRAGYRFYAQSAADFFKDKYVMPTSNYDFYTSDKELGDETGHLGSLALGYLLQDRRAGGSNTVLDARVDVLHYDYPGFELLPSRTSVFAEVGVRFEW
jgi:hypothetical protein